MKIRQKIAGLVLLAAVAFLLGNCTQNQADIYVSPDGKITGTGSKNDPVADLHTAIEMAADYRQDNPEAAINIFMADGDYRLTEPIAITPLLSNLHIIGSGATKVRISGAVPLDLDWQSTDSAVWTARVNNDIDFDQLVVNEKVQILARYPNYDEAGGDWQGHAADALSKERLASWAKPEGAIFHAMHRGRWGGFHYRVTGVDDDGEAILEGGHQNNRPSPPHPELRMVENVLEELDSPGEWYLDKDTHTLYYWSTEEVNLKTARFEGVVAKSFIQIKGNETQPVRDVTIEGIRFQYAKRTFMEKYEPLLRSDWTIYRGGAIFLEGTENCSISDCEFTDLGGNVIFVSSYNVGARFTGNHIHDCGASAVSFVGDPSAVRSPSFQYGRFVPMAEMDTVSGPKNNLYPRNCLVADNLIYRIGRVEKQTAGVEISMSMDITVRHNSIYDVPRAGINIGNGTWGGHILEFNDVFNTVLETGDHGSFNSWGRDRFWHPRRQVMDSLTLANPEMPGWDAIHTTIIRNNRFRCDHGWDIDLDDGSSNYHIYNNLCLNGGIKLREGFYRVVENNIMVNNGLHPHVWFANSGDIVRKNVMQVGYQDVRLQGWGKELDYNLFPDEVSLLKAQVYEIDKHSAFGDPLFQDPEHFDFSLAPASPAFKVGFENFPMDEFGVQKPELKAIAKIPEVPELHRAGEISKKSSPTVAWLRNDIKSVDSKEEQSAYGLPTAEGVIVLTMWKGSPAAQDGGLKKGDVILEVEGKKVKDVKDFFTVLKERNQANSLEMVVMRNQQEQSLKVSIR